MTFEEAKDAVIEILGEEKAAIWWQISNPYLGNVSPNKMLKWGREQKLFRFIESALEDERIVRKIRNGNA